MSCNARGNGLRCEHMKAVFKVQPQHRAIVFMRVAGYAPYANRDGDESFVRRAAEGGEFPRFHAYIQDGARTTISIHIDHKGHTYEGSHAHSGEYLGQPLADELARISEIGRASCRERVYVLV